jgi:hypothetical protein
MNNLGSMRFTNNKSKNMLLLTQSSDRKVNNSKNHPDLSNIQTYERNCKSAIKNNGKKRKIEKLEMEVSRLKSDNR